MSVEFAEHLRGEAVVLATHARLMVNVWFGAPLASELRALSAAQFTGAGQLGERYGVLTLLLPFVGWKMEEDARLEATRIRERAEKSTVASVTVMEESGFKASLARSIISGIEIMTQANVPSKVFKSLEDGCAFVHARLPEPASTPEEMAVEIHRLSETCSP